MPNMDMSPNEKWHAIKWKEVYEEIASFQDELTKKYINKDTKNVYRTQIKIIQSFSARALAVRKVITNSGGRTAGVDNIVWQSPNEYWKAIERLNEIVRNHKKYKAQPLRRVNIPKPRGGTRSLGIPTLIDRAVQALYQMAIDPIVEQQSDPNSFGFRKERSTQDAIIHFRNYMDKERSPRWVLEADITKCFDRINHDFLLENTIICHKHMLKEWLKSGVMEKKISKPTNEGTPQGGIISPMLCNIALNGLERYIKDEMKHLGKSAKIKIIRYADDIVITGANEEILMKCKKLLESFLAKRGLELNKIKTKITNIEKGIDLLGFNIVRKPWRAKYNRQNKQKDVLIIKPSSDGIRRIKNKMREIFKKSKGMSEIIINLNPVLRGWTEHKRISWHSMTEFQKLNQYLWELIKMRFVKSKYGRTSRRINYSKIRINKRFSDSAGRTIFDPARVKTIKLSMKKTELNPYLLENKAYFEKYKQKRLLSKQKEILFKKYKNKCPVCEQTLHGLEKVEIHHINPKKKGGVNAIGNLQPLHRICHIKITHDKSNHKD